MESEVLKRCEIEGKAPQEVSKNVMNDTVRLLRTPLEDIHWHSLVATDSAGAVSSFVGTTRDIFEGKKVLRLEYDFYEAMALKEMRRMCDGIRKRWSVKKIAILHRIGTVPLGKASVVIMVSSVHRKESLKSVAWAIDELKTRVPIWKKEIYENGKAWKENKEFDSTKLTTEAS